MKSDDKEKKLMNLDTELDEIFEEMKEIFKKLNKTTILTG